MNETTNPKPRPWISGQSMQSRASRNRRPSLFLFTLCLAILVDKVCRPGDGNLSVYIAAVLCVPPILKLRSKWQEMGIAIGTIWILFRFFSVYLIAWDPLFILPLSIALAAIHFLYRRKQRGILGR